MNFKNLSRDEKQSLWYPAVSCVQKAVRRCLYQYARIPAIIAWNVNPSRFKMRIFTILYEDCSRDYRLIKYIHQYIDDAWKSEEGMLLMIEALCKGYKSRTAVNLCLTASNNLPNYHTAGKIQEYAGEVLKLRKNFPAKSYEAILNDFEKLGYSVPEWLALALIRCNDQKWEREKLSFFIPYIYSIDQGQPFHVYDFRAPEGTDDTFNSHFLLNGIDAHTRAGKLTVNSLYKKGFFNSLISKLPVRFQSRTGLDEVLWYMNSAIMRNYKVTANYPDFENSLREEVVTTEVFREYEKLLPEINSFKRWAINKQSTSFLNVATSLP